MDIKEKINKNNPNNKKRNHKRKFHHKNNNKLVATENKSADNLQQKTSTVIKSGIIKSNEANKNINKNFFPDPAILQEYEYAAEGAANKILEQVSFEQEKRIEMEKQIINDLRKTKRIGQLFGLIIVLAVIIATTILALSDYENAAIILSISSFSCIAFVSLLNYLSSSKYEDDEF